MFKNHYLSLLCCLGLIFFVGCKNTRNPQKINTPKQHKSIQKTPRKNNKRQPDIKAMPVDLPSYKEITYNYTSADFLDEEQFNGLILSDAQGNQLNTPNGSALSESTAREIENLALAWNQNSEALEKARDTWHNGQKALASRAI